MGGPKCLRHPLLSSKMCTCRELRWGQVEAAMQVGLEARPFSTGVGVPSSSLPAVPDTSLCISCLGKCLFMPLHIYMGYLCTYY